MLERGRWRRLLRRRSVQAVLVALILPAAYGTYRFAVPHYEGRPITAYLAELPGAAVDDPDNLGFGNHREPACWWAFAATKRLNLVVEALEDPDPATRAGACRVLAGLGEIAIFDGSLPSVVAKLVALLGDANPRVRFHAALALGASRDPTVVRSLVAAVQTPDADARLKAVGAQSIDWLTDDPDAMATARMALLQALDDPIARACAVRAASRGSGLWSPDIEERLIQLLAAPEESDAASPSSTGRFRLYWALLRPEPAAVDIRVAQALLRDMCGPDQDDRTVGLAQLWVVDAANGRSPSIARAVRAALDRERPGDHDCPLARRGRPCGREAWYVKRLLESDR